MTSEDRSTSHISHCCEVGMAPLDEKFVRASVVGTPEGSYFTFYTGGNTTKTGRWKENAVTVTRVCLFAFLTKHSALDVDYLQAWTDKDVCLLC